MRLKETESRLSKLTRLQQGDGISRIGKLFFSIQQKAALTNKHGMRWPIQLKTMALSLYLRSPAAYFELARTFSLPSKETVLSPLRLILRDVRYSLSEIII